MSKPTERGHHKFACSQLLYMKENHEKLEAPPHRRKALSPARAGSYRLAVKEGSHSGQ